MFFITKKALGKNREGTGSHMQKTKMVAHPSNTCTCQIEGGVLPATGDHTEQERAPAQSEM